MMQMFIHPVPNGKLIVYRKGGIFVAIFDRNNGQQRIMPFEWVADRREQLMKLSAVVSRTIDEIGLEVEAYAIK